MSCSGEPPFAPVRSRLQAASRASRRAAVLALLLAPAVVLAGATAGLDTGTIIGRVRLVSVHSVAPVALAYSSRRITAPGPPVRDIRNVVVFVRATAPSPVRTATHEMRQQHEVFRPHVLPVTVGSTVSFPNADPFFHNVFSLSGGAAFDLGRYPPGQSRTRVFDEPGLVKVFCHLHAHMSATIMVFDHPWFATPADDGRFEITDVPAGPLTVAAWHERIGDAETTLSLAPGGVATVEFALPVVDR